jgi:signal transduction histidine kinase
MTRFAITRFAITRAAITRAAITQAAVTKAAVTKAARRLIAPAAWLRLPRRTARLRLTVLYGALFTAAGAAVLGVTFWLFQRATAGAVFGSNSQFAPALHGIRCQAPIPSVGGFTQVKLPPGCRLLVRNQIAALHQLHTIDLHTLIIQSGFALAVMAALAVGLGWLVAGRVLRPLRTITATARRISATSLHERLAADGPDDEFTELAGTLNDLLARLQASFTAQRHFVASASHELRTPLTLDRTLLQVALRDTGATVEQWRCTGREVLESGQQQERLLEALLTLATSEAGLARREPVDLAEVTDASLLSASRQLQGQRLRVTASTSSAPLLGDPDLIDRLVANLVDNAVRHNVPGGTVGLTTGTRDGRAVLSVASGGPAIPPTEVDRLFQPFERLNNTRTSNGTGHGLGLSIVAAIATAHDAILSAHAPPEGGLHIEVSFPPPLPPPPPPANPVGPGRPE